MQGALARRFPEAELPMGSGRPAESVNDWTEELEVAERLFANILDRGVLSWPMFQHVHSPMAVFNGDLLLAAPTPDGGIRLLLGDFTGHGLVASIGTVPVAEVFYGMTEKGFSIAELVTEINAKVRHLLPMGRFLAATVMQLDPPHRRLTVWNGGLPDVRIFGAQNRTIEARASSHHLPLGVLPAEQLNTQCQHFDVNRGDRIFACSDSLLEARSRSGELFGEARLEACFENTPAPHLFNAVEEAVTAHRDGHAQEDDLTFVEVQCGVGYGAVEYRQRFASTRRPTKWHAEFRFAADSLREADPLPLVTHFMQEHQGLQRHRERIFVILSELYNNALEHGLLGLESSLKDAPEGLMHYFDELERRLASLEDGEIAILIDNVARQDGDGVSLTIRVTDSGAGLDVNTVTGSAAVDALHGRGLQLVENLAASLRFNATGNEAQAEYTWS